MLPFLLHDYHTPQLKNIAIPAIAFSPRNFKSLSICHMEFFGVSNLTYIFLEIGRNCVPIVITVISNVTVLVSHSVIYFGYFIPMGHGVNKKVALIVSTTSPPYQVFTWFVYCFTRNTLSTFSCSDYCVISVRHWKSTFDFTEIVNNCRLKRGTTCQIVRFISQISLKLYIQF